jgi:hypothetical protein
MDPRFKKGGMFHVKHSTLKEQYVVAQMDKFTDKRAYVMFHVKHVIYAPMCISKTEISLGLMPLIRDACPIVLGFIRWSFSLPSKLIDLIWL